MRLEVPPPMESVGSRPRRCGALPTRSLGAHAAPKLSGLRPDASLRFAVVGPLRAPLDASQGSASLRAALSLHCAGQSAGLSGSAPLAPPCPGATAPYGSPSAGCPALAPCPPRARSMAQVTSPSPRAPDGAHDQPPFCRLMQDVRTCSQTVLRPVCEHVRSWQGYALHPPSELPRAVRHVASGAARAGLPRRCATWLPALQS